ncbi:MAG: methylmalonyl-CoA epimerase [Chloroflexi bacterium]|nr:methylmalonyl-CoA epimerase [Chloroflexota bacterium]
MREIHHVGIAVPSLEAALPAYVDVLGLRAGRIREVPDQAVRVVMIGEREPKIELLEPLDASSGVARFLAERGRATLHHVCFAVDDLAAVLRDLAARGTELVDHQPRRGVEGMVAFLHPRAADGVLIELIDRASIS